MGKKRVALVQGEGQSEAQESEGGAIKKVKAKKARIIDYANIYIGASYNNTKLSATDEHGNVLAWTSAGSVGFKGPRKATPYAATQVVDTLLAKLDQVDIKHVRIFVSGIGSGRDAALRALTGKGLNITAINDVTPVPHNGCKPTRPRRV